jgi:hypothetical protein
MKIKTVLPYVLLLIISISSYSIFFAKADVPAILELSYEDKGGETFLVMKVRHRSPSSNHYVDQIQIKIGENTETIIFESQTTVEFTERHKIDSTSDEIQVRAHCTTHGWSTWKSAVLPSPTPTPTPIGPTPSPTSEPSPSPSPSPSPEPTQSPSPTPTPPLPSPTPTPSPTPEPRGIPGFTTESIIIGLILGAILLWKTKR